MRHLIKHHFLHGTFFPFALFSIPFHSILFDSMFAASFGAELDDEHFALSMVYFIRNGMAWHDTNAYRQDYHIHKGHVNSEASFSRANISNSKNVHAFLTATYKTPLNMIPFICVHFFRVCLQFFPSILIKCLFKWLRFSCCPKDANTFKENLQNQNTRQREKSDEQLSSKLLHMCSQTGDIWYD